MRIGKNKFAIENALDHRSVQARGHNARKKTVTIGMPHSVTHFNSQHANSVHERLLTVRMMALIQCWFHSMVRSEMERFRVLKPMDKKTELVNMSAFVCCTRRKIRFSSKKNKKQEIEYMKIKHVFLLTKRFSVIDLNGIANLPTIEWQKNGSRLENVALAIYALFTLFFC